jgi:hypothetical protein
MAVGTAFFLQNISRMIIVLPEAINLFTVIYFINPCSWEPQHYHCRRVHWSSSHSSKTNFTYCNQYSSLQPCWMDRGYPWNQNDLTFEQAAYCVLKWKKISFTTSTFLQITAYHSLLLSIANILEFVELTFWHDKTSQLHSSQSCLYLLPCFDSIENIFTHYHKPQLIYMRFLEFTL